MRKTDRHKVLFIGIGGIGMSALARYYNRTGWEVYGYDKTPTALTAQLQKEGIRVFHKEEASLFENDTEKVIYTPAISTSNALLTYARERGLPLYKRAEILGILSKQYPCIAVAGTHGKTTISGLLSHIFHTAGIPILAFVGGITTNYHTNLIYHEKPQFMIVEADEYDRSFLQLHPNLSVISSIAPDHLNVYGNYEALQKAFTLFAQRTQGTVVTQQQLLPVPWAHQSYGLEAGADYVAQEIRVVNHQYEYTLSTPKGSIVMQSQVPGRHNVENAVAAVAIAQQVGIPLQTVKKALASYRGIKRRYEFILQEAHRQFIDDYAHHPEEMEVTIRTTKELFPGKKITGVFQPHLYSRTQTHAKAFASVLSLLDEVILLDIYPAREAPIPGVTSQLILQEVKGTKASLVAYHQLTTYLAAINPEVLLTMGAGDIDKLIPQIKERLKEIA